MSWQAGCWGITSGPLSLPPVETGDKRIEWGPGAAISDDKR